MSIAKKGVAADLKHRDRKEQKLVSNFHQQITYNRLSGKRTGGLFVLSYQVSTISEAERQKVTDALTSRGHEAVWVAYRGDGNAPRIERLPGA